MAVLSNPWQEPPPGDATRTVPAPETRPPHAFHFSALAGDQAQTFLQPSPMPSTPGALLNPEHSLPTPNGFPVCESVISLPNETKLPREGPGLLPDVPHRASMVRAATLLTGATTD